MLITLTRSDGKKFLANQEKIILVAPREDGNSNLFFSEDADEAPSIILETPDQVAMLEREVLVHAGFHLEKGRQYFFDLTNRLNADRDATKVEG